MTALAVIAVVVALLIGIAVGWWLGVSRGRTDLARHQGLLEAKEQEWARSRETLREELRGIAATVVRDSREQIGQIAQDKVDARAAEAAAVLDARKAAVDEVVAPIQATLAALSAQTAKLELERSNAYTALTQQVGALDHQARTLSTALSTSSQARGRWGEVALRRLLELSGLSRHVDFTEQTAVAAGKRPDVLVRMPGGRVLPIDAKAPGAAYLEASALPAGPARDEALARHAKALREQVKALSAKDYAAAADGDFDHVVLFIPSEAMAGAAFDADPTLLEDALARRVLIASPVTLLGLLRTIEIYWRQHALAENTRAIHAAAQTLVGRVATFVGHLDALGSALGRAGDAYNNAVGSYQRSVLPQGRRLAELEVEQSGAGSGLPELAPFEVVLRSPPDTP